MTTSFSHWKGRGRGEDKLRECSTDKNDNTSNTDDAYNAYNADNAENSDNADSTGNVALFIPEIWPKIPKIFRKP